MFESHICLVTSVIAPGDGVNVRARHVLGMLGRPRRPKNLNTPCLDIGDVLRP